MISFPTIIKGTLTGVRISAVDAGAFLDNCADVLPYVDGKSIIRLKDSGGKYISAILGAVGTGETYLDIIGGTNPALLNGDFESAEPPGIVWDRGAGWTIESGVGLATGAISTKLTVPDPTTQYALHRMKFDLKSRTAGEIFFRMDAGNFGFAYSTVADNNIAYRTSSTLGTGHGFGASGFSGTIDNVVSQKVLTPSALGCTLLNAIGGAQSFISTDAAFTYNAASYTYEIFTTLRIANPRSIMGVNTFRN